MLVQLYAGHIEGGQPQITGATPGTLDRAVMLVYEGEFNSMDGPVVITADHLSGIADNHNSRFSALKLAAGDAGVAMKDLPPLQLDHSTSARDTIGRLVGPLRLETVQIEGRPRRALMGIARFIGEENVQKASDGRYTHVSIGADLETNELSELSVTPFPAAKRASLLTAKGAKMDKEKLRKHLMKTAKCSAEEADEKLSKMSDDDQKKLAKEVDDDEKKLAAEEDEKAKKLAAEKDEEEKKLAAKRAAEGDDDDEEKKKKDLSAANEKLTRLRGIAGEAKKELAAARAEMRRGEVQNRLAKLRANAKLTPAEQKALTGEIKLASGKKVKLSEVSDDALELAFAILEAREKVVHVGQFGSIKPLDLSDTGKAVKGARLSQMEAETLANMPFTSKALKGTNGDTKLTAASDQGGAPMRTVVDDDADDEPIQPVDEETMTRMAEQTKRLTTLIESIDAAL